MIIYSNISEEKTKFKVFCLVQYAKLMIESDDQTT